MMAPLMLPSVQWRGDRIARLNLLAAAAMLAIASLLLILFQWYSLQASFQRNLRIQADMLAPAAALALRQDNPVAAQQLLAPLAAAPHVQQALLYSPYGAPFARYAGSGSDAAPAAPQAGMQFDYLDGHAALLQALPGGGALYLRASLAPLYLSLAQFSAFTLLVCLCAFGLTVLMVRRTRAAAQHAENHLHYLAHVEPNRIPEDRLEGSSMDFLRIGKDSWLWPTPQKRKSLLLN
ncbi:CHASE sensor domain-containing protein, partial [Janthinobacterium sp.]|uniref:CHASE sensor domain-containing protein n=1 Tax=Janthinobacterium sp. TaxID=1871054 RepID=UPI002586B8AB